MTEEHQGEAAWAFLLPACPVPNIAPSTYPAAQIPSALAVLTLGGEAHTQAELQGHRSWEGEGDLWVTVLVSPLWWPCDLWVRCHCHD